MASLKKNNYNNTTEMSNAVDDLSCYLTPAVMILKLKSDDSVLT